MFYKRSKKYNMPKQAAVDVLKNVLEASNVETPNINFDLLLLKGLAQTNLVDFCKWIAIGFLFLALVSPVALMNSQLKVDRAGIAPDKIIIEDYSLYNDHFILKLIGDDIDYESIFAKTADGKTILPTGYDRDTGEVIFPYAHEGLTIYISDKHGHTLNAKLSAYDK
ncbi:MAG TPA: hypothetical protein DIS78_08860 [Lachnospiraceae bacterium]|nr:hypothetical protein [Lachnospiraceae bacterium]